MLQHTHLVPGHPLKLRQKSYYIHSNLSTLSGIWEKISDAEDRRWIEIFTYNKTNDRVEDQLQPGYFKESVSVAVKESTGILRK
jgi:hypothetical protein